MPKRLIDSQTCELQRALRFTGKSAEFISFRLPRKKDTTSGLELLYPQIKASVSSHIDFDQWAGGKDAAPIFSEFNHEWSWEYNERM